MAGLIRNVLIPASRRVQQGARSLVIPASRHVHQGAMSMVVQGYNSPTSSPRHYTTGATGKPINPMTDDEELKIRKVFSKYDKNNDGWISRGEWYDVVFKFLGDRDAAWILAEKIMDDLDVDCKNEKVTYSEFRAGMKSQWHLFKPKISNVSA